MFLSFCSPREECICAQTLLLQLLQSCFPVLQRDVLAASQEGKPAAQSPEGAAAAKELYTHLCDGRGLELSFNVALWGFLWSCEPQGDCCSGR